MALGGDADMTHAPRIVLSDLAFPEGPRWRDGELYFSDMHSHEVVAMTPQGARRTVVRHSGPVSGLGWLPDGRMLVVSMLDRKLLRQEADGSVVEHADMSHLALHNANDMVVDAKGRAYVGNFGFAFPDGEMKATIMVRVDPDGTVRQVADELMFPNGAVITPDDRTLVVGESFAGRLTAYDIAPDGGLSNRRVWAQLENGAVPDGISLDAEGAIWVASPPTKEALRVHEGGKVSDRVKSEQEVFACMLGGPARRTLYLLTANSSDPAQTAADRAGRIEATEVTIPGAGRP
jgi:sugar lactone lactonase YvrE